MPHPATRRIPTARETTRRLPTAHAGTPTNASSLISGLVAYWSLSETSGTRFDSGPNHFDLTAANSPATGTGQLGQCASLTHGSNQYFNRQYQSMLAFSGTSFMFAAWLQPSQTTSERVFVSTPGNGYLMELVGGRFGFQVALSGAGTPEVTDPVNLPAVGVNSLVFGWLDTVAKTINVQVNNHAPVSSAATAALVPSTDLFYLGGYNAAGTYAWDGLLGPVMCWNRVLSASERATLWNGSAGNAYPFH